MSYPARAEGLVNMYNYLPDNQHSRINVSIRERRL